jgi:hypothetical protein
LILGNSKKFGIGLYTEEHTLYRVHLFTFLNIIGP